MRELWLQFLPKSMDGIKVELREQQETVGIPVPVLRAIGAEIAKTAGRRVDDFIPLTRLLWDAFGREGRVVTVYPLGAMELAAPEKIGMVYSMRNDLYTLRAGTRPRPYDFLL